MGVGDGYTYLSIRFGLPPCLRQKLLCCCCCVLPRCVENEVDVEELLAGVEDCRKMPPPARRKLLRPILVTFPLPALRPLPTLRKLMLRLFALRCCINVRSEGSLLLPPPPPPPAAAVAVAATVPAAYLVLAPVPALLALLKLRLLSPIASDLLLLLLL